MAMRKMWTQYYNFGGLIPTNSSNQVATDLLQYSEVEHGARLTPSTVTRIIGQISWIATAEATVVDGTNYSVSAGITVLRRDVVSASSGDAQIPDPELPDPHPWLWKWSQQIFVDKQQTNSAQYPLYPTPVWTFDIRAQRKLEPNETLALVINSNAASTHPPTTSTYSRHLLLLP